MPYAKPPDTRYRARLGINDRIVAVLPGAIALLMISLVVLLTSIGELRPNQRVLLFVSLSVLLGVTIYESKTVKQRFRASAGELVRAAPNPREYLVPVELPPVTQAFVGRQDEIERIRAHLEPRRGSGPAVVVVHGVDGIGKTTLAVRVTQLLAERYPGGRLFAEMSRRSWQSLSPVRRSDETLIDETLAAFVTALKGPVDEVPPERSARVLRYQELVRQQPVVIVLDDVDSAEVVNAVLPQAVDAAVLITAPRPLSGLRHDPLLVALAPLTPDQSLELFRRIAPQQADEDSAHARELMAHTGGHPHAVQLTAASLAARPHHTLSALRHVHREVSASTRARSSSSGLDQVDLTTLMHLSYVLLTEEEQYAFRLLGTLDQPTFALWMLAALMETDESTAARVAERLVLAGLIWRTSTDSAGVPLLRISDHVRKYAHARLHESTSAAEREELSARLQRRRSARHRSRAARPDDEVYRLLQLGRLPEALTLARAEVELAREKPDQRGEGLALAALAEVRAELGSVQPAEDLALAAIQPPISTPESRARGLRCLSRLYRRQRDMDTAEQFLVRALAEAEQTEDRAESLPVLRDLAVVQAMSQRDIGRDDAIATLDKALAICRQLPGGGRPHRAALGWASSVVYHHCGRMTEAERCLDTAEQAAVLLDQRLWLAWIGHRRGVLALANDSFETARTYATDALAIFGELNHRYGMAHARRLSGQAYLAQARAWPSTDDAPLRDALWMLEQALEDFANCGDPNAETDVASELATANRLLGERAGRTGRSEPTSARPAPDTDEVLPA